MQELIFLSTVTEIQSTKELKPTLPVIIILAITLHVLRHMDGTNKGNF